MAEQNTSPTLHSILASANRRIVLFAVLLASAMLLFCGVVVMRDYAGRNLELIARTVAYTVEPAIVFDDAEAIHEGMVSVGSHATVDRLVVAHPDGAILASWSSSDAWNMPDWLRAAQPQFLWPQPARLEIIRNGRPIAEVRVYGSATGIFQFVIAGILIAGCCIGITLIATGILGRQLRMNVTSPLLHAVEVARSVRVERAFDRRVPAPGVAEVDHFVEDFNLLLAELQGWYNGLTKENQELARRASHDVLTGLGNRVLFEKRIEAAISSAQQGQSSFAVLFIDGNRFKQINDCHGHDAGDAVLSAIAGIVAVAIIDLLEAIAVDKQHGKAGLALLGRG
ncbi:MAG: diguanylate cyclase, partial [Proteobacteria bacterium]